MKQQFISTVLGLVLACLIIKCEVDSRNEPFERFKEENRIRDIKFKRLSDSLNTMSRKFFLTQLEPNILDSLNRKQGNWAIFFTSDSIPTKDPLQIARKLLIQFKDDEPVGTAFFYNYYKKQLRWKVNLIRKDSIYVFDKVFERYNAGDSLIQSTVYKAGLKNGVETFYYPNGNRKSSQLFYDNILEGKSKYFFESGKLKEEEIYKGGILSGLKITYYESGAILTSQQFIQGKLNGPFIEYFENGSYKIVGEYSEGNRCCNWKYFNIDGSFSETKFLPVRVGAMCYDGTRSYATGRGACSHHGGVNYWLTEIREIQIKDNKSNIQSPLSKYNY